MKIPGKVAPWFWAILLAGNALILYEMIVEKEKLAPLLVGLALLNLLCIPIVARNYVLLEEDKGDSCLWISERYHEVQRD